MRAPGLTAAGSISHPTMVVGELGMLSPARVGRSPTFVRFGPATPLAPGTPVDLCIRPTQVLIVRPDRMTTRPRENLLWGHIVGEVRHAEMYTLHLQLDDSTAEYDLEVMLPGYVYHRLDLETTRRILVELRRQTLHVIPPHADTVQPISAIAEVSHLPVIPARG